MKTVKNQKINLFRAAVLFSIFFIFIALNYALSKETENEVLIFWNTNSFSPSNYIGKSLPTNGSTVSLFVIAKEADKILDVGSFPILWYIDGDFYNGAIGKTSNSFKVKKMGVSYHSVTVEIRTPQKTLQKTITIPVVQPKVILDIPSYNNMLSNKNTLVSAIPYFFNTNSISNLDFSWNVFVEGQKYETKGDSRLLLDTKSISTTTPIEIFVLAQNKKMPAETARGHYKGNYVQ